ncbi:RusA family crossover junction endodeoxyribonuclease [Psychrobacter sp. K31L]|uniref:RusA family crossover junction endodeoxyribonuclease n=1 Tax=Psychrobacter sp. K31L TaxID=2820758 RepID=UPI001B33BF9A|nr:RusA family crossover junction endodeoxyribonuclease [Psychrobacter sp. K31L]MBP3945138.1 RusA family crossover junction endodeoxyribonuclease [Psychrobacter sp. K31L]
MTEPFFKAQLPMPPSVNGYWLVKPKGKYLSAKARKFRSEVIAYVASLGRIRTHTGRIRAQVTIHGRDKRKFDIDNYQKALWDALTHARVIDDDELIDELNIKRGEIIKGGRIDVELYELKGNQKGLSDEAN